MKPLLAHVYEPHRVTYPCYVQPKLNGIRALYQHGHFQSRDQLPFPDGLLAHLAGPLAQVFAPDVILDGELYVHGWPLQRINAAVTPVRLAPTEDTVQVQYHVFDQVDFTKTFKDRSPMFGEFIGSRESKIRVVTTLLARTQAEADIHYARWVGLGYEGQIYRLGDCPYTVPKQQGRGSGRTKFLSDKDNRTWHLLKRKDWQDDEFECIGVVEGEGKLQGMLGAVKCIATGLKPRHEGHTRTAEFFVGSGLTDSERQYYWQNPPIGRLVKVKYLCLSSDGIPLNPTILAIL